MVKGETKLYVMFTKGKTISGLKSCKEMHSIKFMDEAQQDSSDSIIEKNVRKIKGKTEQKLKEEMLKLYPEKFTGLGRPESP